MLERFLYRLSVSPHRDLLILKGGKLPAALDQRRPTRDVDLLATAVANNLDTIAAVLRDIAMIDVDDGLVFDTARMTTRSNLRARPVRRRPGGRTYHRRRGAEPLRADVNVGDPVPPARQRIVYPALLGEPFELISYPIETVLAEKLVTMVALGAVNTRERDFADVLRLTDTHAIDAARPCRSVVLRWTAVACGLCLRARQTSGRGARPTGSVTSHAPDHRQGGRRLTQPPSSASPRSPTPS